MLTRLKMLARLAPDRFMLQRFNVGQQNGQQADQRQKSAEAEDKFNAGAVRQLALAPPSPMPAMPKASPKNNPAIIPHLSRHKFLRINQDGRKKRTPG